MLADYSMKQSLKPWTATDRMNWRVAENKKPRVRSYYDDVLKPMEDLAAEFAPDIQILEYGVLNYDGVMYPLQLMQMGQWDDNKPSVFVQGGTHGYEPSGVAACLCFAKRAQKYMPYFNVLILPCTSPWSYETDNRWNPDAEDPNRAFTEDTTVAEASLLMDFMNKEYAKTMNEGFLAHFSFHEAHIEKDEVLERYRAARDGTVFDASIRVPDGFFLISDTYRNDPDTEKAIIGSVKKVTDIAIADDNGAVYGQPIQQEGVIYAHIIGSDVLLTHPKYAFTTEVTPDSKNIKGVEEVVGAHIAAIEAGLACIKSKL